MNQYDGIMTLDLPYNPSNGQELWVRNCTTGGSILVKCRGNSKYIQREAKKEAHTEFTISGADSQKWYHGIFFGETWFF